MKKVYYLSTCDTCKRIIQQLKLKEKGFEFQDIKFDRITKSQLNELKTLAGSFHLLFSKTSRKYKELNLAEKELSEEDYSNYILQEYTFLKRPVIVYSKNIFIGNAKKTIDEAAKAINV